MVNKKIVRALWYFAALLAVCFGMEWGFSYILATARRKNELRTGKEAAGKSEREKVLSSDPRAVLAGLDADTRARIDNAEARGIDAGLVAACEALHRRGGARGGYAGS